MRTPPPTFKVPAHSQLKEDEDITILFEGNRVVSIDGQSLWLVLRVCDGQRESGIDASRMHTAFQYKKWELQHQDQVKDIVSLGKYKHFSFSLYMCVCVYIFVASLTGNSRPFTYTFVDTKVF